MRDSFDNQINKDNIAKFVEQTMEISIQYLKNIKQQHLRTNLM